MNDSAELSNIMLSRTLGHFPLSIATSLALEVAYGMGTAPEENPTTINELIKYDGVWINIRTLARNIYNSVATADKDAVTAKDIAAALDQEMTVLEGLPQTVQDTRHFIYYFCTHEHMEKKMKHAQFKLPTTAKQQHYAQVTDKGIAMFIKSIRSREKDIQKNPAHKDYVSPLLEFDCYVKPERRENIVLLTHHMLDFVHYEKFKQLTLLESHTGALKGRDRWYTKFSNGREIDFVPFNAATLQIFGDSDMFKPYKASAREEILKLSNERNWHGATSDERFLLGLSLSKNKFLYDTAKDMIRSL